jgi:hypothetical protein
LALLQGAHCNFALKCIFENNKQQKQKQAVIYWKYKEIKMCQFIQNKPNKTE